MRQSKYKQESGNTRINKNIKAEEIRLIDPNGKQIGIVSIRQALFRASDYGLDLVEISPNTNPPVCKIMDYGRFRYKQAKKNQEAKKKQVTSQIKEIKVTPSTEEYDLKTKMDHIKKFISKKDKVKVTVVFKGRELNSPILSKQGRIILDNIAEKIGNIGFIEQLPKLEGKNMAMIISPK